MKNARRGKSAGGIKYGNPKRIVSSSIISDIKVFDYNSDGNHDIIYRTALAGSPSNYVLLGNGTAHSKSPWSWERSSISSRPGNPRAMAFPCM